MKRKLSKSWAIPVPLKNPVIPMYGSVPKSGPMQSNPSTVIFFLADTTLRRQAFLAADRDQPPTAKETKDHSRAGACGRRGRDVQFGTPK